MGILTPHVPHFKDAMDNFANKIGYGLYCHIPATIVAYATATRRATVQISLLQVFPDYTAPQNQTTQIYDPILNVPVFFLSAGAASAGGDPIPGDSCLLLISDRDMDAWKQTGSAQAPLSDRSHNITDAFAIVGFTPLSPAPVSARLPGEFGIADAAAKVVVKNGLINISSEAGANSLLMILTAVLTPLSVDPGVSTATKAAALAALTSLAALLY